MSGPLWMPLHIADFARDTRHLSAMEKGAYLELLMTAWTSGGALPTDEKRLARIAGLNPKEWNRARETLLDFLALDGDVYRQKRIDLELEKASELIDKKRAAGKASARARAQQVFNGCSTGVATEGATDGQQNANQSQSQGSVSKDTGGEPPKNVAKDVYDNGVALLCASGSSPAAARSLIGRWRKTSGDHDVLSAIIDASRQSVSDPKAWITARLNKTGSDHSALFASIDRTFGPAGATQ